MIIAMSAELMATIVGTIATVLSLAITIIITAYFSNKSTRKLLEASSKSTKELLEANQCTLNKLAAIAENSQKTLDKVAHLLHEVHHTSQKIALGMRANALMHSWKVAENVTNIKEIEKIAEEYEYSPELKICYYKPKKTAL